MAALQTSICMMASWSDTAVLAFFFTCVATHAPYGFMIVDFHSIEKEGSRFWHFAEVHCHANIHTGLLPPYLYNLSSKIYYSTFSTLW